MMVRFVETLGFDTTALDPGDDVSANELEMMDSFGVVYAVSLCRLYASSHRIFDALPFSLLQVIAAALRHSYQHLIYMKKNTTNKHRYTLNMALSQLHRLSKWSISSAKPQLT